MDKKKLTIDEKESILSTGGSKIPLQSQYAASWLGAGDVLAFGLGGLFIAFALYISTQQKIDIANADLVYANATITGNTDQITTLQTGNETPLENLDSAALRRMSLQLQIQVREGVNG